VTGGPDDHGIDAVTSAWRRGHLAVAVRSYACLSRDPC
jgi:hypothetical protein